MPSPTYVPVVQNGGPLSPATLTVSGQTTLDGPVDVNGAATFDGAVTASAGVGLVGAAAATDVLTARVTGDADPRLSVDADGRLQWGDGSGAVDTNLYRSGPDELTTDDYFVMDGSGQSSGTFAVYSGSAAALQLGTAGGGIAIEEGANARMGVATLVGGTLVVNNTSVTANTRIFLTCQTPGGTPGFLRVSARTAATSFTILSSSGTDTSVVAWLLIEPN